MEHIHKVIIVLLILALIFAVAAVTMASTFFDFKTWSFKEKLFLFLQFSWWQLRAQL
ncbi:hypothetical protein J4461_03360 [Candidatus Pacearchaeota archaeon]|nr:hypothetical protein [Candidatus Pacearchaeota archaeon]